MTRLYIDEDKSMGLISEETKISVGKIHRLIHQYGIPTKPQHQGFKGKRHTDETKSQIRDKNTGKVFSDESKQKMSIAKIHGGIGHKKKRSDGYIAIYFPDHPLSNSDGYIMEHQLVMECLIGRHLEKNECVHHINFIRDDNRKENLQLMTVNEHMSFHSKLRHQNKEDN